MMTHKPAWEPSPKKPPEQPMLPFEQSNPLSSDDQPEVDPCEVWKALSTAMRAEVRRDWLQTMREVVANA
jgi:hypothetical protein